MRECQDRARHPPSLRYPRPQAPSSASNPVVVLAGWLGREDSNLGIAVDMLDNARALPTCSRRSSQACCDGTTKVPDLTETQCRHDQSMCSGGRPISARVMRIGATKEI